ncbi:MAG: biotin transporter BioY [Anaerolineae bacterium]|nr:biotin transporter BioY [Anaerolineae bacterium]
MLRTLPRARTLALPYRLAGIGVFTITTILAARMTIEIGGPVPFTLQPLAVLLAGMVLGARDGALSQFTYVALIASGMPYDARMLGSAALFGPTGGFLIGFIAAAFLSGLLVERGGARVWQRWLAGIAGVAVLYLIGVIWLKVYGQAHFDGGMSWAAAWMAGAAPFLVFDLVKALIAAALTEGGRALLNRR